MSKKNSFHLSTQEVEAQQDKSANASILNLNSISARRAVPSQMRKPRQLSQQRKPRVLDTENLNYETSSISRHSLSLNNLHPSAQAGGILFKATNHHNSSSIVSGILNLDISRKGAHNFLIKKDLPPTNASLLSSPSSRAGGPTLKMTSLQNINSSGLLPGMQGPPSLPRQMQILGNIRGNLSSSLLSSARGCAVGIKSNSTITNPPKTNSLRQVFQTSGNPQFILQGESSNIGGKTSFYHHSHIFNVKHYRNITDYIIDDGNEMIIPEDLKDTQKASLLRKFRNRVQQYLLKVKFRKEQAEKDFNEFYNKIQDSQSTKNSQNKGISFSTSNAAKGNNEMSFFSNNINTDEGNFSISALNQSSIDPNKSLQNIDCSRFNFSKMSKQQANEIDSVNVEIYLEDSYGKQRKTTRALNHLKLQDLLFDRFKPLLTTEGEQNNNNKIQFFTDKYERILQTLQSKPFKLKIPPYYEPLMQPYNDFYQIDLDKKREYQQKEQWKEIEEQIIEQAIEEKEIPSNDLMNNHLQEQNEEEEEDDEDDENEESEQMEKDEEGKNQFQRGHVHQNQSIENEIAQTDEDQYKKGGISGMNVKQVSKKVVKKKKRYQEYNDQNTFENEGSEGDPLSSRKSGHSQGNYQYSSKVVRRNRQPKEKTAMEEYITYRPPSNRAKKQKQEILPVWVPPQDEEEKQQQSELEMEEQAEPQPQTTIEAIPATNISGEVGHQKKNLNRKKRDKPQGQKDKENQIAPQQQATGTHKKVNSVSWKGEISEDGAEITPSPKKRNINNNNQTPRDNENDSVKREQNIDYKEQNDQLSSGEEEVVFELQEKKIDPEDDDLTKIKVNKIRKQIEPQEVEQPVFEQPKEYELVPQEQADEELASKRKIGTGLFEEIVKLSHLLDLNVDKFKKKRNVPELPEDFRFQEEQDQKLFNSIFQWQYEVDQEIEEANKNLYNSKSNRRTREQKKEDSDDEEEDPENINRQMGRMDGQGDNNSVHSSEITDFGPAEPLHDSVNNIPSDEFD